jgi:hypothetical protein
MHMFVLSLHVISSKICDSVCVLPAVYVNITTFAAVKINYLLSTPVDWK